MSNGVGQDYLKAKYFYELDSQFNYPEAITKLGDLYFNGNGVGQNYSKAEHYYNIASNLNFPEALMKLGDMYYYGYGIQQRRLKAISYYESAASHKNPAALFKLGCIYSTGTLVQVDLIKSMNYFETCFNIDSKVPLSQFLNDPSIPNDRFICLPINYNRISGNNICLIYLIHFNNITNSIKYIKESCYSEFAYAQYNYGLLNLFYLKNKKDAKYFLKKSAKQSFSLAYYELGYIKEKKGHNEKSINYYIKASECEDEPLKFHDITLDDEQLKISKTMIICLANFKIANYFLSNYQIEEAKKYFIKCFNKFNNFEVILEKNKDQNIFEPLKSFIFESQQFNLGNQPTLKSDFLYKKNIERFESREKPQNSNIISLIEIKTYEPFLLKLMSNIFSLFPNPKDYLWPKKKFVDPGKLFDYSTEKEEIMHLFIEEIKEIIHTFETILYKEPYPILFGRIELRNNNNKKIRDINDNFYLGLDLKELQ